MEPEKQPKAEKPSTSKPTDKAFDVTNRSAGMPSANARPTIITHRAIMRDPMVSPSQSIEVVHEESSEAVSEQPSPTPTPPKITKTRIEPLHADVTAEEPASGSADTAEDSSGDTASVAPTPEAPLSDGAKPEDNPEPVPADDSPSSDTDDNEDLDEMTELAGQAAAKKAKNTEAAEEEKRQAAIQKLIDGKKYNLPIHSSHGQPLRHRVLLVLGVVVIAVVVGGIAAIDAGLIDIGFELPFDLI